MPSFGDIMDAVDLLQVKPVELDESICVRATNRNSNCDKCAKACIADAFSLSRGEIEIDYGACLNCGCCVPACPTSALSMAEPSADQVSKRALKSADAQRRCAVFACSRIASKNVADPDTFAEVPCLGHVSEQQILDLIKCGYDDILFVDGDCSTCKLGAASSRIDESIETASEMLDACGSQAIVTRLSEFPEEYRTTGVNSRGEGRRGLLRQTTSYVKTVAENVARKTLDEKLQEAGLNEPDPKKSGLKYGKGIMNLDPVENYALIEDLETLSGDECGGTFGTRHFGNVFIDTERCSGCGMCVLFCPTKALKYAEFDEPEDENLRYCEFQAADCVQCELCKDVCLRECLEVSPTVSLEELLDFEPRLLEIAKAKKTTSLAGLAKRNH